MSEDFNKLVHFVIVLQYLVAFLGSFVLGTRKLAKANTLANEDFSFDFSIMGTGNEWVCMGTGRALIFKNSLKVK